MAHAPQTAETSTTNRPSHAWRRAFADLPREHGFEPLRLEGRIPEGLRGTLYRNGPSLFSAQGRPYGHWFDGDGAVSAVRFSNGRAEGAVKVVQSTGLVEERRRGRGIFGGYGTRADGNMLRRMRAGPKNAANTSVIVWQDKLYALWEGGRPTELDPADLSTRGERTLDGTVVSTFSAHPHYVPQRKAAYNFGLRYGRSTMLDVYVLPDEGPARLFTSVPLPGPTMIHDFIATARHLVFFVPPLRISLPRILLGGSLSESLRWRAELGTEVIVIPIDAPTDVIRVEGDAFYQWHFANAFEQGEELIVDAVSAPDFSSNAFLRVLPTQVPEHGYNGRLTRHTINLQARTLQSSQLHDGGCEFPRIAGSSVGKDYRYTYVAMASELAGNGLFDQVARVDVREQRVHRVSPGADQYPSEPIFVRRPDATNADDGWLLTLVYDGPSHTSHIAVLDAAHVEDGPIARAHFDHHLPFTFHGNFVRTRAQ